MRRSRALMDRQELLRLLHSLGLDQYPKRPHSPAPPETDGESDIDSHFHDDTNQIPADWDQGGRQPETSLAPGFGGVRPGIPRFDAI